MRFTVAYVLLRNDVFAILSVPKALQDHYGYTGLQRLFKTSDKKVAKAPKQKSLWKHGFEALKDSPETKQKLATYLTFMADRYKK